MTAPGTMDRRSDLRRWITTWVAVGAVVVLVTAVFLVLIGNSLVSINSNLATADRAVTDVAGHTKTLPDQIDDVNAALTKIDGALVDLPGDTEQITANLEEIRLGLRAIDVSLVDSAPRLDHVSDNLTETSDLVEPIASRLSDTSALLRQILGSTGRIHSSLVEVNGMKDSGLEGVEALVRSINDHLMRTSGDLGNILEGLTDINGHLDGICRSTAVNLLHGAQSC
jgi:archaellum component FlaC